MPLPKSIEPPRISLSNGTLEALKWFGVIAMTLDHVNRFILRDSYPSLYAVGRLAFPLFAFVLGWNLARPGVLDDASIKRIVARLLIFGAIATIPYVGLLGLAWWKLNILFTLLFGAIIIFLCSRASLAAGSLACLLFLLAGNYVDYNWAGIALCVTSWAYSRQPSWPVFCLWGATLVWLTAVNQHIATLLALPLLLIASRFDFSVPRFQYFFYWYYPLHLALIGLAFKT